MKRNAPDPFRHFEQGFPLEVFNLVHEEIGMTLSKCGGVDMISLMDVLNWKGKLYPERSKFRIFSNFIQGPMGRPLMSPAIRFFHRDPVEGDRLLSPGKYDALPDGVEGLVDMDGLRVKERFLLGDLCGGFNFKPAAPASGEILMSVSKYHLSSGEESSLKNQCACVANQWGIHWLPAELRDKDFDINYPFPENYKKNISKPVCRIRGDLLIIHSTMSFAYGSRELYTVFAAPGGKWKTLEDRWYATVPYGRGSEISFGFGCGTTLAEAEQRARKISTDFSKAYAAAVRNARKILASVPEYEMPRMPAAEEFLSVAPVYQYSLLVAKSEKEAAIQASARNFGYFALWDHIYPIRDFMCAGDTETARKLLRYLMDYPHMRYAVWASMQMILALNENLYFDPDMEFVRGFWTELVRWFRFALTLVDKKTGLLKFTCSMGCDNPLEMGLVPGLNFASCMNGWWYSACRVMENFAIRFDDRKTAKLAASVAEAAGKNYHKAFWDDRAGYPRPAVGANYEKPARRVFVNTSSIAFDYPFGRNLLRRETRSMARYQKTHFYMPQGRNTTSWDSEIGCEMWKNVHMNQHTGHECKLARFAGDAAEAGRIMEAYLRWYKKYGTAIETFNYSGCPGDVHEIADWQAFSVTGAITGLTQGVIGLSWHAGGLCYTPADDSGEYRIRRFPAFGRRIDVRLSGSGPAASLFCDGREIPGTMQVPADVLRSCSEVKILRKKDFGGPALLMALDLPVVRFSANARALEFTAGLPGHCPILCHIGNRDCSVTVDGKAQPFEKEEETGLIWFDPVLKKGSLIRVEILPASARPRKARRK